MSDTGDNVDMDGGDDHSFDSVEAAVETLEEDSEDVIDEQPETEDEVEAEEVETENEEEDSEDDVVMVDVNGEQIPVDELKDGYFRQKDYTHKTTELAEQRKAFEVHQATYQERLGEVEQMASNLSEFIEGIIPAAPDPSLASTDPQAYMMQLAQRDQIKTALDEVMAKKNAVENHTMAASATDMRAAIEAEDAKLVKAMPHLKEPARFAEFLTSTQETAKSFGFSDAEVQSARDSRLLQMVHYAKLGQQAERNLKKAKKTTVKPQKGKAKPSTKPTARKLPETFETLEDAAAFLK